jgi:hypothetical protein
MRIWSIKTDHRILRTNNDHLSMITDLIEGVGGKIVLETVNGDGYVSFKIQGYMETDSRHLADRVARLIHSVGGRAKLREEIYSPNKHLVQSIRQKGGYHPHFRRPVMTR